MYPLIDTHCHVYPDKIAEKAATATAVFYKMEGCFDGTLTVLKEQRRLAGISHSILCSVATTPKQVHSANRYLAEIAGEPGFFALGTLHPDSENPEADVEEIERLGLLGAKLHPDIQGFSLEEPRARQLFEICEGRIPVLLHLGDRRYAYSNPKQMMTVLRDFPKLKVIGAHFGGWSLWEDATEQLYKWENLTVDCSSSMFSMSPETAAKLIRMYGADRVLFGTDYPLMSPVQEVERFRNLPITEEEREKIAWKNTAAFYNLELTPKVN